MRLPRSGRHRPSWRTSPPRRQSAAAMRHKVMDMLMRQAQQVVLDKLHRFIHGALFIDPAGRKVITEILALPPGSALWPVVRLDPDQPARLVLCAPDELPKNPAQDREVIVEALDAAPKCAVGLVLDISFEDGRRTVAVLHLRRDVISVLDGTQGGGA